MDLLEIYSAWEAKPEIFLRGNCDKSRERVGERERAGEKSSSKAAVKTHMLIEGVGIIKLVMKRRFHLHSRQPLLEQPLPGLNPYPGQPPYPG